MYHISFKKIVLIFMLSLLIISPMAAFSQQSSPQPPANEVAPDQWPKASTVDGTVYTIYQPQVDSWDGYNFNAHAAVSVLPSGAKDSIYGVINIIANTQVDKISRIVTFVNVKINKAIFPSAPDLQDQYCQAFQNIASNGDATASLDQIQSALSIISEKKKASNIPLQNMPPSFIFSQTPAILISINGNPVWRMVSGSKFQRIINTRALILKDISGNVYLHLFDGFMKAPALSGPFAITGNIPAGMDQLAQSLAKQNVVDLMAGQPDDKTKKMPSLANGSPAIYIVTTPAELIVTNGAPQWTPLQGTMLLYVSNTTGNVFRNLNNQRVYILSTGRWFSASDINGPWQYVAGKDLPQDFSAIPDTSPKENVKASIPGTPQSKEALIANGIPQSAKVDINSTAFKPVINGTPLLSPINDTPLYYVSNCSVPVIKVDSDKWYACQNGIWFFAPSVNGPWTVAKSVPSVVYSIPPTSPLYYVTNVKVYSSSPDSVTVGYTPGYMGTAVSSDDTVVYGTGYDYQPVIDGGDWYPAPVTYGYAANQTWTPWTGWAMGFGLGWLDAEALGNWAGWGWGVAPYWGAVNYSPSYNYGNFTRSGEAAWGPNGWAATSGNVYSRWGNTGVTSRTTEGYNAWTGNAWSNQVGHSYNSVTGQISAGQRGTVQNVYTGNYATKSRGGTYNPATGASATDRRETVGNVNTGQKETVGAGKITGPAGQTEHIQQVGNDFFAEKDGSIYKNTGGGWQQINNSGAWNRVNDANQIQNLDNHQWARTAGDQRAAAANWGGRWGGGFDNANAFHSEGNRWGEGGFGGFRGGFGGFHGGFRR